MHLRRLVTAILLAPAIFLTSCEASEKQQNDARLLKSSQPIKEDDVGLFVRTKVNGGALDANGSGNDYSVRGTKYKAQWKWLTPNNNTPPYPWLKWTFDSSLLKSGPPPDLEKGPTGQVCLECNASSIDCDIIVGPCHGGKNQRWTLSRNIAQLNKKYFSISSELHPTRCLTMAGTLTKNDWYWDIQVDNHGTTQNVKKYRIISGEGYKLALCTGSDQQSFYVQTTNLLTF